MTTAEIIAFKNFILSKNTYLDQGFAIAYKDTESGRILCREDSKVTSLMPADNLGNYFYLRLDGDIRHTPLESERISDCGPQRLSFLDTLNIVLVASVKDADYLTLSNNLRDTCMKYTDMSVIPASTSLIKELIVVSEMQGMEERDISATLQRLKNETIIKLNISINKRYISSNCIVDPCKTC